ncbi:menaquinol oxidoreductase complex Cbc7, cytochrome c subunit, putative, 9 heme-binding sites [Geotalea daltonii FRC-32]|uniref:Menaquinol oxidoreductase complex Cbc7, cytochrome c subunit, putative, 9 heme-binding sites n=1 Tax=Geotalea daltonii (strain DSM 22248 / JCM 15807 / FRC-32) TaxID=316067 RepID=B9M5W8_GEODF|nr:cytochrome c3 family protein [Geotalea daltonii]ACM19949.1 menaquinol oxidoreductase complex Cbc7, cytochrome c subunit, putative, 9 heme-binding sites [Geotalea daltonii FRC-32]
MRVRWTTYILAMLFGSFTLAYSMELKDKTFNTEKAGKVVFSHSSHLKKKNARTANVGCKSCHNSNLKENVRYTMADMDKGKSCGMCHNGAKAFALSGCTSCHKVRQITYNVKETGPTTFSHSVHLKTMQCSSCHNAIFKPGPNKRVNMAEMEKGKSCGACHDGKKSFALSKCTRCHPVKDRSYKIAGAGNVEFSHVFHLDAYGCKDCHAHLYSHRGHKKAVTMAEMEKGKSCGACHDSKTAFTVKENCDRCHKV